MAIIYLRLEQHCPKSAVVPETWSSSVVNEIINHPRFAPVWHFKGTQTCAQKLFLLIFRVDPCWSPSSGWRFFVTSYSVQVLPKKNTNFPFPAGVPARYIIPGLYPASEISHFPRNYIQLWSRRNSWKTSWYSWIGPRTRFPQHPRTQRGRFVYGGSLWRTASEGRILPMKNPEKWGNWIDDPLGISKNNVIYNYNHNCDLLINSQE